jgi:methylated-DNA-[protein]-cysteine S-methyltransferase
MSTPIYLHSHPSPIGELLLLSDGASLIGLQMEEANHPVRCDPAWIREAARFDEVRRQLDAYLERRRRSFDLPLAPRGTPFQQRVWRALQAIPYAGTASYGEVAQRIGSPRAVRAVGGANGRNPIAIVIPCHRVVGADGSLTGFGGGLERKRFLLELEGASR